MKAEAIAIFLAAIRFTGYALNQLCDEQIVMDESFVMSENIADLASSLEQIILPDPSISAPRNSRWGWRAHYHLPFLSRASRCGGC